MAPLIDESLPIRPAPNKTRQYPAPLKPSGALDQHEFEEMTPVIGREFPNVNIVDDILNAPNADELVRDLAITISQRGVVFFRAQNNLTDTLQKQLVHKLGQAAGKPADSTLHIHPVLNNTNEFGVDDAQVSTISSLSRKKMHRHNQQRNRRRYDSAQWHSDIQFEPVPADYTSLRLTQLPKTGGDTLWASGYEIYDRFSKPYQKFFETLTATYIGDGFIKAADADPENIRVYTEARGNPLNVGRDLSTVHPIVRTNPVTGWKSIYAVGPFPKYINELNPEESDDLLKKFYNTILENHDLTVRFKWRNENDIAIWDNRSAFHTATFDYEGLGERFGHRAVGIGEKPYLDPNSKSRTEALATEGV
ncbi:taurine dioxygenase family protein [Penicillium verhagenii]|nr:taurine dioxygenase family protein [Penicillium verhagenii]